MSYFPKFSTNEWIMKKVGDVYKVGYVKNVSIVTSAGGIRYDLVIVGNAKGGTLQLKTPSKDICSETPLEAMNPNFFDKHQDFRPLFDLALATGDEDWFNELLERKAKAKSHEPA